MSMSNADQAEYDRNRWSKWSNEQLIKEWGHLQKACFDRMFGHNARHAFNNLCDVLLERGVTHIPNLFEDIEIRKYSNMYPMNPNSTEAIRARNQYRKDHSHE